MSLNSARGRLLGSLKELHGRWERVSQVWDDPVRADFEKHYIHPLDAKSRTAVAAMEQMEELLAKAKRDCSA